MRGIITILQEDRLRLEDEQGHGFLFTLGRKAGASMADLHRWSESRVPVAVQYEGPSDLRAVAVRVQALAVHSQLK